MELEINEKFEPIVLEDIVNNHTSYAIDILLKVKPFTCFEEYLKSSAYPFYRTSKNSYIQKLLSSSMQILETDLPMIYTIDHDKINSLKKMMIMLCQSQPYDINISKLCGTVELNQRTLDKYLGILQAAWLVRILGAKSSGLNYPKSGDFRVDEKYTFEIGGRDKNFKQLKDVKNGYVVADDIEIGVENKTPLWLFLFLY